MKSKRRKSKRRILERAVYGGLSRLRKRPPTADLLPDQEEPVDPNNGTNPNAGILRPGTASLRLPTALAEAGETDSDGPQSWMPGPVVITIAAAAIAFIAIIAWFVSRMPAK